MAKKTIRDINVSNKKVLVRCDFNVPQDENGTITDNRRIVAALPTIQYLLEHNAKIILCSHLGRPKGEINPKYSLKPVAEELTKLLGREVKLSKDVVEQNARELTNNMKDGEIVLLENVRFEQGEEKNDPELSKAFASLAEIYVNDAFGTAHRAHSSTTGVADYLPAVSGFLIEKELKFLGSKLENPERPFVSILGGVKVSDKISYLGRDIEDAIEENFLTEDMLNELSDITGITSKTSNSAIINTLVTDICKNSSPEEGIRLSKEAIEMMDKIKVFNYKYIYGAKRMNPSDKYFEIVINQIFDILKDTYDGENTPNKIRNMAKYYPNLLNNFYSWIEKYWNIGKREGLKNKVVFDINKKEDYIQAIIYYISGMTDKFAIDMYNEIIHF